MFGDGRDGLKGIKKKKGLRQSHVFLFIFLHLYLLYERSLEHTYSNFMLLSSFPVAETLLYKLTSKILCNNMNALESLSYGFPNQDFGDSIFQKCQDSSSDFVLLSNRTPPACPSAHTYWKARGSGRLGCWSCSSATWLWFVVEGEGMEEIKKPEMVNDCRF